jgi:autotransporter-associated beta strand protein
MNQVKLFTCVAVTVLFCGLVGTAQAANGTAYYLDVNGATDGFGDPANTTYAFSGNWWTTTVDGTGTPGIAAFNAQYTFGYPGTAGISNSVFTFSNNSDLQGITVNVPCTVTLSAGSRNANAVTVWSVVKDATLNITGDNWNYNWQVPTLQGAGTINVVGTSFGLGVLAEKTCVQDMNNGVVNLMSACTAKAGNYPSYKLQTGTLNFANAASASAFSSTNGTGTNRVFALYGGTLDNTSGNALTLDIGNARYEIGGSFTFAGTSSLNFNTNTVNLKAGTRTITVNNNTLTFGGAITNSGGLVKAGAGTLVLSGTNTYSGATTVSNGTLYVTGVVTGKVTVAGGVLGGTGTIAGTVTNSAMITAADTNSTGTLTVTNLVMKQGATYVWNYNGASMDVINVTGLLALPDVATVTVSQVSGTLSGTPVLFNFGSCSVGSGNLSHWVVNGLSGKGVLVDTGAGQVRLVSPTGMMLEVY